MKLRFIFLIICCLLFPQLSQRCEAAISLKGSFSFKGNALFTTNLPMAFDMFYDGEGPVGVTNSLVLLTNQTHAPSGSFGPYSFNPAGGGTNIQYAALGQLVSKFPRDVIVNGAIYNGSGSTGFRVDIGTVATSETRCNNIPPTNIVYVQWYVQLGPEADFASGDLCELRGQNGTVHATAQWRSDPSTYIVMHTDDGASVSSQHIPATNNAIYLIQMRADTDALLATLAVFDVTNNYAFLGVSTLAMGSSPINLLIAPQMGNHGQTSPTAPYIYSDNYLFRYGTNAPYVTNRFLL